MSRFLPNLERLNICILGEDGVGKSALTLQFVQSHFVEDYDPTLEETYSRVIQLDSPSDLLSVKSIEYSYILDIVDTVGIEDYSALRDNQIQEADAIILCYNIASRDSYDVVTVIHQQILRCRDEEELPPIILCGAQSDLTYERQVSYQDGEVLVDELNLTLFMETSAKLKVNVEELFKRAAEEVVKQRGFKAPISLEALTADLEVHQEQTNLESDQQTDLPEAQQQDSVPLVQQTNTPLVSTTASKRQQNLDRSILATKPSNTAASKNSSSQCCIIM